MDDAQPPDVSVVISTYNRCSDLAVALDALLAQNGRVRYEVIVVDNNSSDGTRDLVAAQLSCSPQLRYVFEGRQGLPYARNAGTLAARAPIVAYTDDDVRVGPDWVERIKRTFDTHPDVDAIGGRIVPTWPQHVPSWVTKKQLAPFALGERGNAPIRVSAVNAAPCLVGANFAFRREIFDRIGLFDPEFIKSQDREIQLRLWRAGGVGLYAPDLAIQVDIPTERLTKKYFRYWYRLYGVYHSRMGLLDAIDHDGRLTDPPSTRLFGVPSFIYRQCLVSLGRTMAAYTRLDSSSGFYWENRSRYLISYIRERFRRHARQRHHSAVTEVAKFVATLFGSAA